MKSWIKALINNFVSNAETWYTLIIAFAFMFVSLVIIAIVVISQINLKQVYITMAKIEESEFNTMAIE